MTVESTRGGAETAFQWSLNSAITTGLRPSTDAGLGAGTRNAIDKVALDHPDAEASLITAAFDAFASEYGAPIAVGETDPG